LAKPNYSGEKRRKELEKQKKKEAKKQRKLENASGSAGTDAATEGDEQTPADGSAARVADSEWATSESIHREMR
jgi:hypothetical protein